MNPGKIVGVLIGALFGVIALGVIAQFLITDLLTESWISSFPGLNALAVIVPLFIIAGIALMIWRKFGGGMGGSGMLISMMIVSVSLQVRLMSLMALRGVLRI